MWLLGGLVPDDKVSGQNIKREFALDGRKFNGLYLGRRKGNDLIYAGKVDLGVDPAAAKSLQFADEAGYPKKPALRQEDRIPRNLGRTVVAGRNRIRAKSAEGKVRHPFFKGIREDL
jgi:bifunctional non-homologous end joining protein LigD